MAWGAASPPHYIAASHEGEEGGGCDEEKCVCVCVCRGREGIKEIQTRGTDVCETNRRERKRGKDGDGWIRGSH